MIRSMDVYHRRHLTDEHNMEVHMENNRFAITFKTSDDLEAKVSGESRETTTTIIFTGWTDEDFKAAAAETVKIRQIQPRLRKGQDIGDEFVASRPGTKGASDPVASLVAKAGSIEAAIEMLEELNRRKAARA
jgi:hypothetical protein